MDSDFGIPRELSDLQKHRCLYEPELPPCLQVSPPSHFLIHNSMKSTSLHLFSSFVYDESSLVVFMAWYSSIPRRSLDLFFFFTFCNKKEKKKGDLSISAVCFFDRRSPVFVGICLRGGNNVELLGWIFCFFFFLEIFVFDFPFWLTAACITVLKWYINRTEENLSDLSI